MTSEIRENKKLPWPVIIMLAMLASVIGLGFLLSPKSETDKLWWVSLLGTTNHGILLNPPVDIPSGSVGLTDGASWPALESNRFKLVVINDGSCEQPCQGMLREIRQVHVRLNRDYEEVERAFLPLGLSLEAAEGLVQDVPGYLLLDPTNSKLLDALSGTNIPSLSEGPFLLMVDPANLAMMAYTQEHSGSEVLEDLEHLLELAR